MKNHNRRIPIVFYVGWVLLFLGMVSWGMTSGLYAKYTSRGNASDEARVAQFIFDTEKADKSLEFIEISSIEKPGDQKKYEFTVSNGTAENCSEVVQNYQVSVTISGNMPLAYTLQKNGDAGVSNQDNAGTLPAGKYQCDHFVLTVEWPKEKNDIQYANGSSVGEVILTITSEQAD